MKRFCPTALSGWDSDRCSKELPLHTRHQLNWVTAVRDRCHKSFLPDLDDGSHRFQVLGKRSGKKMFHWWPCNMKGPSNFLSQRCLVHLGPWGAVVKQWQCQTCVTKIHQGQPRWEVSPKEASPQDGHDRGLSQHRIWMYVKYIEIFELRWERTVEWTPRMHQIPRFIQSCWSLQNLTSPKTLKNTDLCTVLSRLLMVYRGVGFFSSYP